MKFGRETQCRIMPIAVMAAAGWLVQAAGAEAFPLLDQGSAGTEAAAPSELSPSDAQDLRHQLQLAGGLAPPPGGGWTIIPSVSLQEAFNDNIFQVHSPRRADLTTYLSPGIAIAGDTSRLQLTARYSPMIEINAINGSQNALTQQLNAVGRLTVVPDRLYIDLRAVAGVQATNGLLGNYSSLGNAGPATASTSGLGTAAGNGIGLAKNNRTQTWSAGISPYTVGRLGSYGDYRIGGSVDVSHSASANDFFAVPFGGGNSTQSLVTTQQVAHFSSGDYLTSFQDQLDVNLSQSQTKNDLQNSQPFLTDGTTSSNRESISDQLTYHYNQTWAFFGSLGWEVIKYSGSNQLNINEGTWSIGTTVTPNPDTSVTLSYGRHEGQTAFNFNARYAATARTVVSASYSSTVGTQLQNVQRQLDLAAANQNGGLVNGQTGGTLFNGNTLGVQPGVYRFNSFVLNSTTNLDRDSLNFSLGYTNQKGVGSGQLSTNSSEVEYGTAQWIHSLTPLMTLSGAASYTRQQYSNGSGLVQSVAMSAALQYTLSETVTTSARYLFNDQIASHPSLSLYQDLFILGITKQF